MTYEVGDIVLQNCGGTDPNDPTKPRGRWVRVTAKHRNIKNGRPGFDGDTIPEPDRSSYAVWGYDWEIIEVKQEN